MNNIKWEHIFFIVLGVVGFSFIGFLLYSNQIGESKDIEAMSKLKEEKEINETIRMLVEVAYQNDTTRFNDYQKSILKAIIKQDVTGALKAMAPQHKKVTLREAGDAILKAFKESPEYPIKP